MIKSKISFLILIVIAVVSFLILSGCSETQNEQKRKRTNQDASPPEKQSQNKEDSATFKQTFDSLKQSLLSAQKESSEISPQTYQDIESKIKYWEGKGYAKEMQEIRNLLSQLKVGGQIPEISAPENQAMKPEENTEEKNTPAQDISPVRWDYKNGKWIPTREPPACPEPLVLKVPVDLERVNGILYPGQVRGDDFKPHGGFATDGEGPDVVSAPLQGYIKEVAYFTDEFGVHYMYDIQHECGIMVRMGHLGAVPEKFQEVFDAVPKRGYRDSVTMEVESVLVEAGEIIATNSQTGKGFDFGLYDLRKENQAAKDPAFREKHADEAGQAYYALCWLDWFTEEESNNLKALPGVDGKSGKESAYCE